MARTKKVAFYVVDNSERVIVGKFYERKSAREVRQILRPISDMFLEVGTNVRVIKETHPKFKEYATSYTRRGEPYLRKMIRAAASL